MEKNNDQILPDKAKDVSVSEKEEEKEVIHAKLKCQGCGSKITIKRAIKDNWAMCDICGSFLCKTCQVDYATYSENVCPGSKVTEHHQIQAVNIPLDILYEYIKDIPAQLETNPVYKAFFEEFSKTADPFGEVIYEFTPLTRISNKYAEQWMKLKNVIVQKTKNKVIRY